MRGIYISTFATQRTQERLAYLLAQAASDLPTLLPTDIHVTLAHDKDTLYTPQELSAESDPLRTYTAKVLMVEQWETGNGNPILVASLFSPELHERWSYWRSLGLHWDFPTFRAHFSLTDGIKGVSRKVVAKWCRIFNEALQDFDFEFTHEYVQYIRADAFKDPKDDDIDEIDGDERPIEESTATRPAKTSPVPMEGLRVHRPQLNEHEEKSMRNFGFNAHGIIDRVHDHRIENEEDEEDGTDED